MTQEELAEKAEIDTSYLGQIERGKRCSPGIVIIAKIAQALNVSEGELLGGEKSESAASGRIGSIESNGGIPERIATELSRMTPREQQLYDRIFRALQELSELKD